MNDWSRLARSLDGRITSCGEVGFQVGGQPHIRRTDPLTGAKVLVNPARKDRPRPGPDGCPYCAGATPPTLSYVRGQDRAGDMVVEAEEQTLRLGRALQREGASDPYALVHALGEKERVGAERYTGPLVFPGEPWLARTFLNLVPTIISPGSAANCFVVGVTPGFHAADLGVTLEDGCDGMVLPDAVPEAIVASWTLLEEWSEYRGLLSVPFVNGGKGRESGQSIRCFHAQFYSLNPQDEPPIYSWLREERAQGRCPVCTAFADEQLRIHTIGSVDIFMHPAPARNLSMLLAPRRETARLRDLDDPGAFARAIQWAVRAYERLLGGVPAYNVVVRTGSSVGHLHAEVIPRSYVNIPAGFEGASGFRVVSADPHVEAERLRGLLRE